MGKNLLLLIGGLLFMVMGLALATTILSFAATVPAAARAGSMSGSAAAG